jgi:hypothetical protein
MAVNGICPDCGRPLDIHDQHIRFALPDDVIAAGLTAESEDVWIAGEAPRQADFMAAKGIGFFVRSLVAVQLTDEHTVTYGVWIRADEATVHHAHAEWHAATYSDLVINGRLANELAPWEVHGAEVTARPRTTNEIPYVDFSTNSSMTAVLTQVWPHDLVLPTLPTS